MKTIQAKCGSFSAIKFVGKFYCDFCNISWLGDNIFDYNWLQYHRMYNCTLSTTFTSKALKYKFSLFSPPQFWFCCRLFHKGIVNIFQKNVSECYSIKRSTNTVQTIPQKNQTWGHVKKLIVRVHIPYTNIKSLCQQPYPLIYPAGVIALSQFLHQCICLW